MRVLDATPHIRFFWEGASPPGWREPLRLLYDTELVLVGRGGFILEIAGRQHRMAPGSFALVPPATWHQSWVERGRGTLRHCLHFVWDRRLDVPGLPLMVMHESAFQRDRVLDVPAERAALLPLVRHGEAMRDAGGMATALIDAVRASEPIADYLLHGLLRWLVETAPRATPHPGPAQQARSSDGVRAALAVKHAIDSGYAQELGYGEFTALSGLSPGHLCTLFRQVVGLTPTDYLAHVRIGQAQRLLRDGARPMRAVASAVGIPDQNYFARVFRRRTGLSPSAFVRAATGG